MATDACFPGTFSIEDGKELKTWILLTEAVLGSLATLSAKLHVLTLDRC
jgi:hypothetical protein